MMKLLTAVILGLVLLGLPDTGKAQSAQASRAWKPFLASFRAAVKKRDRAALSKLMARDFYYLSSGGDENSNQDTRDEAFDYWESTQIGAFEALDKVLADGIVTNTGMRELGNSRPSRIGPPLANDKKAHTDRSFPWYAVFEFRKGRWYWTAFTECCD